MHRVGIRGVLIMEVDVFVPKGPVRFLTPQWREMFQHALKEATRLGITVDMNNDGGWCGSGGPWITPELSMQIVVSSETRVGGPRRFSGALPQPKATKRVLSRHRRRGFPHPARRFAAHGRRRSPSSRATGNVADHRIPPALLRPLGHDRARSLPRRRQRNAGGLRRWPPRSAPSATSTVSWPAASVSFDRVRRGTSASPSPSRSPPAPEVIPLGDVELHGDARIEDIPGKAAYVNQPSLSGGASGAPIPRDKIVDLTALMDATAA